MIYGFAAAVFLGMAILFVGVAVSFGIVWAWPMALMNFALFGLSLMMYGKKEEQR